LVCRWENTALSRHWPTDGEQLLDELGKAVEPWCPTSKGSGPQNAQRVVAEALAEGRVALILDAVDQAGDPSRLLNFLNTDPRFLNIPVLITGRSFAFRAQTDSTLFPRTGYKFITLLPFDENQQGRMLADVCPQGGDFRQLFANYADVQELLGVVGMLAMVRELAGEEVGDTRRAGALTRLRTRCDFYYQFYRRKMLQAARKPTDLREHALTDLTEREPRWHKMLAVTAFRMVLEGATSYSVAGNVAGYVQDDVRRYLKELDNIEVRDDDWASLRRFSVLSDYSVLEGRSEGVFSWRHKGWLEYFCGVFLACYADPAALAKFDFDLIQPRRRRDDATAASPDPLGFQGVDADRFWNDNDGLFREVMTQLTNDPQWRWGWRFAAESPRISVDQGDKAPFHPRRLRDSLANLFRLPAWGCRPTELIHEAFYLFEADEHTPPDRRGYTQCLKDPAGVLAEYRASGQPMVGAEETSEVWEDESRRDSLLVNRKINAKFALCPPEGRAGVFLQGATTGSDGDEQPRHQVRVNAFRMQTCPITRGQYRCFDGALERESATPGLGSSSIASLIEGYSRSDNCPAILVSWFDAWAFARWLGSGYRLPTESEWEFACRAGGEDEYTFGSSEAKLREYAWFASNSDFQTYPVAAKRPNRWGLFDVHGNVWEWCQDWYGEAWYAERIRDHLIREGGLTVDQVYALSEEGLVAALGSDAMDADAGPAAGFWRVLRGGSWDYLAVACRSAYRTSFTPESRDEGIGFRVCRGGESEVATRPRD
jgi:formylglycine-generating enzyme required for sulfatase activity